MHSMNTINKLQKIFGNTPDFLKMSVPGQTGKKMFCLVLYCHQVGNVSKAVNCNNSVIC
jgi:hypothetical protein